MLISTSFLFDELTKFSNFSNSIIFTLHPRFLAFFKISCFEIPSRTSIFLSQKTIFQLGKTAKISAILNLNSLQSSNANIFLSATNIF
jgi:hypothetical protein